MNKFQERINYRGDLEPLMENICADFNLGKYKSHVIVPIGYEDFNLFLLTETNKYFVKIFGSFRNKNECDRYIGIMETVLKAGISHPKLYKSNQGYLYEITNNGLIDRLCVMEFIDGKIFYELQTTPTIEEMKFIIKQTALINKIDMKPKPICDHWAITSFLKEYKEKGKYLSTNDKKLIEPMLKVYESLSIDDLPHCFVHGDITKTNVMRNSKGDLFILDFAVANYYPRIQELAVILCDLFFDAENHADFLKKYELTLTEYQKNISLTEEELKKLPNYVKLAHTMHILLSNYEKVAKGNNSDENEHFLNMGRVGLEYTNKLWKN